MTKKGEHHKKNSPKPRVAIYVGAAGSGAAALGAIPNYGVQNAVLSAPSGQKLRSLTGNIGQIATQSNAAIKVAAPAVLGIAASVAADKLGLNKALAKAKMPFRI